MTTIELNARGATATAKVTGQITEGAVGIPVTVTVDSAWAGIAPKLVASCGGTEKTMLVSGTGKATLPWECLKAGQELKIGIDGASADGSIRIPTIWASCGRVQASTAKASEVGQGSRPTGTLVDQFYRDLRKAQEDAWDMEGKLDTLREDVDALNHGGLIMKEDFIGEQVQEWLDEHPDATTTVQDGAVTIEKIALGALDYVTPQMFPQDTILKSFAAAIQFAAENGLRVWVPAGDYSLTGKVRIDGGGNDLVIDISPDAWLHFSAENGRNIILQNFGRVTITGGHFSRAGELADLTESNGIMRFDDVMLTEIRGVKVDGCLSGSAFVFYTGCRSVTADSCSFENIGMGGLLSKNSRHMSMTVRNCTFRNFQIKGESPYYCYPVCITFTDYTQAKEIGKLLEVDGCLFENCQWEGPDSHGAELVKISNSTMHNCARFFMDYMDGRLLTDPYHHELIVENCLMFNDDGWSAPDPKEEVGASLDIFAQLGRVIDSVMFRNCTVINPHPSNIWNPKAVTNQGISISMADNVTIEGCNFVAGHETGESYALYLHHIKNATVRNCSFKGFRRKQGIILAAYVKLLMENNFFQYNGQTYPVAVYKISHVFGAGNTGGALCDKNPGDSSAFSAPLVEAGQPVNATSGGILGYIPYGFKGTRPYAGTRPKGDYAEISATVDTDRNCITYQANSKMEAFPPLIVDANVTLTYENGSSQKVRVRDFDMTYGHKTQLEHLGGVTTYGYVSIFFHETLTGTGTVTISIDDPVTARYYNEWTNPLIVMPSRDLNEITEPGMYFTASTSEGMANKPKGASQYLVLEVRNSVTASTRIQRLYDHANAACYYRILKNAGWTSWYKENVTAVETE